MGSRIGGTKYSNRLWLRMTPTERAIVDAAAELDRQSFPSVWIRRLVLDVAREKLGEARVQKVIAAAAKRAVDAMKAEAKAAKTRGKPRRKATR